jgi:hypothetical protein
MPLRSRLPHRLRLVFDRDRQPQRSAGPDSLTVAPRLVDLTVYAGDCRARGRIALDGDRITDLLNSHDEVELVDVMFESFEDGRAVEARDVVVARDEVFAVAVGEPRGDPQRRTRTQRFPVSLQVGTYSVRGYLHVLPGADPILGFRHRRAIVPLTDAWIEYEAADGHHRTFVPTLLVNRALTEWIEAVADEDIELPEHAPGYHLSGIQKGFIGQPS